ncbi:cytochrome c biogenesis protein CcsA [Candidatus Sumerlaeota bacterium]|nr:cytochrome c biogenesis protein CcsA [Candidatus Sumerlaeota bacterium]
MDALQSYWLRIHVTSMLTSYAFFSLAFFTAGAWVLRRWYLVAAAPRMVTAGAGGPSGSVSMKVDPSEDQMLQYLDGLTFRIITIGFPILTGGVILGAVWASEAWGRPWGFDPKETAAAITWMIYAIYLHCRLFLGWRGSRGIWLSILGFGAVVFTYLGVSFFLPGLHSYVSEGVSFKDFLKGIIPGI